MSDPERSQLHPITLAFTRVPGIGAGPVFALSLGALFAVFFGRAGSAAGSWHLSFHARMLPAL